MNLLCHSTEQIESDQHRDDGGDYTDNNQWGKHLFASLFSEKEKVNDNDQECADYRCDREKIKQILGNHEFIKFEKKSASTFLCPIVNFITGKVYQEAEWTVNDVRLQYA